MGLTAVLFYTLLALVSAFIYALHKRYNYWKERGIPHDAPNWLMGNVSGFRKTHTLEQLYKVVYKKYKGTGPFCGFYFFQRPAAFILDTNLAKNILIKDFTNFTDRGIYHNERDDPLTGHLFALDGIKWKQLRQKLTPTFTSGKMKFMYPTVVEVAESFMEVFGEMCAKSSIIEVRELLARFTTDVIGTCAFGIECNSLRNPEAEFRLMGRVAFSKFRHGTLIIAFMQSFPELARKLRLRQTTEDVHQFFLRIVRETVAYREQHNIKRNDFMDMLIELKNSKSITLDSGEVLSGLTVEEVAAQAFVFFLAGFETSSTAMTFVLYELAQHSNVQDKLRKEIEDALARHQQQFSYECMRDIPYLDQVMSETLRLHTIVPNLSRRALNSYTVPGHPNYVIEKGIKVLIPSACYHHDAEYYPEPFAFKPERFTPEMVKERESVLWLPFGDGPRNCIGMRFGQMQSRIALTLLLRRFKFSVSPETQIPMQYGVQSPLLGPKAGVFLRVERI